MSLTLQVDGKLVEDVFVSGPGSWIWGHLISISWIEQKHINAHTYAHAYIYEMNAYGLRK